MRTIWLVRPSGSQTDPDKYAEAEQIQREVLGVQKRVLGAEHPDTLTSACNLAASLRLSYQGKYADSLAVDAERIQREVHHDGVQTRVLGAEHCIRTP